MKKIRVTTPLATTGKEALQIYHHLPMTKATAVPKATQWGGGSELLENTGKMVTTHEKMRYMIRAEKETITKDKEVERRKHLVDTVGERGNIKYPEDCAAWGEICGKCGKKNHFPKVFRQKATTQLHQIV